MFRLDRAHKFLAKRRTPLHPHLWGPYSHRLNQMGPTLSGLSLKHEGEELVSAAVARGQTKVTGKINEEAEALLAANPEGRFALIDVHYGCRVPFLYVEKPAT